MKTNKAFCAVIVLFLLSNFLFAQEKANTADKTKLEKTLSGVFSGFMIAPTYSIINAGNLNKKLLASNYPQVSNNCFGLSIGIITKNIKGKLYGTIEYGVAHTGQTSNGINTSLSAVGGAGNINYNVYQKDGFLIHPFAGLAFSRNLLSLFNNSESYHSFDTIFKSSYNSKQIQSNQCYFLNVGIGLNKILSHVFLIGIETGYKIEVNGIKWYDDNNNVLSNSPNINTGGFYARIILGYY